MNWLYEGVNRVTIIRHIYELTVQTCSLFLAFKTSLHEVSNIIAVQNFPATYFLSYLNFFLKDLSCLHSFDYFLIGIFHYYLMEIEKLPILHTDSPPLLRLKRSSNCLQWTLACVFLHFLQVLQQRFNI